MKRILFIACVIISVIGILVIGFILADNEWILKEDIKNINVRIESDYTDFRSIEEQANSIILKQYKNAYLGEIIWKFSSIEEFEQMQGNILYKYYAFLGTKNGYDRYAICDLTVNLTERSISNVKIYGNRQMGGEKLKGEKTLDDIYTIIYNDTKVKETIYLYNNIEIEINVSNIGIFMHIISGQNILLSGEIVNNSLVFNE